MLTSVSEPVAFVIAPKRVPSEYDCHGGVNTPGWIARLKKQEGSMIRSMIRLVVLATVLMALVTTPVFTQAFAMGGGGGGGGAGGGGGGGAGGGGHGYDGRDPYSGAYSGSHSGSYSYYPNRLSTKATHSGKRVRPVANAALFYR